MVAICSEWWWLVPTSADHCGHIPGQGVDIKGKYMIQRSNA